MASPLSRHLRVVDGAELAAPPAAPAARALALADGSVVTPPDAAHGDHAAGWAARSRAPAPLDMADLRRGLEHR